MDTRHSWFPIEWSAKVKKKPIAAILNGTPIVLFRTSDQIHALLDRCPHRGAPLSKGSVQNGNISCPYHGWCFDKNGKCTAIPGCVGYSSKEIHSVPSYSITEKYGLIWVCQDPSIDDKNIPDISLKPKDKIFHLTANLNSGIKDVAENALDPLHTHFVHSGLIRTNDDRKAIRIQMRTTKTTIEAEYCNEMEQEGIIHKILSFGRSLDKSYGRFIAPCLFQMEFRTSKNETLWIHGFISPIEKNRSKTFLICSTDAPIPNILIQLIVKPLFFIAMKQDKKILDLQSRHVQAFGKGKETSTKGDLFGPYLDLLLEGKELPEKEYEVELYV